jgi:hypothetical protein
LCRYGCKEQERKEIEALKEAKRLDELAGTGGDGEGGIDNSRLTVA